jgi:hypothetical protein
VTRRGAAVTVAAALAWLAACGGTGDVTVREPAGGWRVVDVTGAPAPDTGVALGMLGGTVVLLTETEGADGLEAWRIDPSTGATERAAISTDEGFLRVGAVASGDDRLVAAVTVANLRDDGPDAIVPWAYVSTDGREWQGARVDTEDADVLGIASTDDGFVAVGALRTGPDPSMGPFAPVAWRSPDGTRWSRVPLPGVDAGTSGTLDAVAVSGDEVLVSGAAGRSDVAQTPFLWRSRDSGETWERDALTQRVASIASAGDALIAGGAYADEPSSALFEIADGTLRAVELDDGVVPAGRPELRVRSDGDTVVAFGNVYRGVREDPHACYDDPYTCDGSPPRLVVTRHASGPWRPVALPPRASPEAHVGDALVTPDGLVLVLTWDRTQVAIWDGAALPTDEPRPPQEPGGEPPVVEYDATLEPGVRYRFPLYVHCEFPWLGFNNRTWRTDSPFPDALPEEWPVAQQSVLGEIELVAPDRIDYVVPGAGVIATYHPTTQEPPGCD